MLEWLKTNRPHAALVDINLGEGPSFRMAEALRKRNIPLIFLTGYEHTILPAEFADNVRLQKPIELKTVSRALAQLLKSQSADANLRCH